MGSKHDRKTRNWAKTLISVLWNFSGDSENIFHQGQKYFGFYEEYSDHQNGSGKIVGIDHRSKICRNDRNQINKPRSSRWLDLWDKNMLATIQTAECLQKLEVSPCMEAVHAAWHVEARGGSTKHEVLLRMQSKHAASHVWAAVAPCMSLSHPAWHLGGVVVPCMSPGHAESHVEHEVPPYMRPKPCRATHGRPPTWIWLAAVFYKYPAILFSFRHLFHTKATSKTWLEREREKKKVVDLRVWSILNMVDSEDHTPPRRTVPSNRRFSMIVTRKLCPINPSKPVIFSYNQVEVLSKISSVPRVQISQSSAWCSAGKSEKQSRS